MSVSFRGVLFTPVLALNKANSRRKVVPQVITLTFADNDTLPDFIVKAAERHGITPEMFIKRILNESVDEFRPPVKDASEFNNLDAFLKGNGYRK